MKKRLFLIGAVLFTAVLTSNAQCACCGKSAAKPVTTAAAEGESVAYFKAAAMRCGGCAGKVKNAIGAVEGVTSVEIDLPTKSVKVAYDASKTNIDALKDAFHSIEYSSQLYYPSEANIEYATYKAPQIKCGGCAGKVKKTLSEDAGVKDVAINIQTKEVAIAYDKTKTNKEKLQKDFQSIKYNDVEEVY